MPDFLHESHYNGPVIGIDEAGRGPWAGPVTVTAIWLCPAAYTALPVGIDDSKKLKAEKRKYLASHLCALPHYHHTISLDVDVIDHMGILQATFLGMVKAASGIMAQLQSAGLPLPIHALVDGNLLPPDMPLPSAALVKGDSRSLSIAAASIIAKSSRDRIMQDLHGKYPGYGWDSNMGYGTAEHSAGLDAFGVTPHHRRSFKPVRRYIDGDDG